MQDLEYRYMCRQWSDDQLTADFVRLIEGYCHPAQLHLQCRSCEFKFQMSSLHFHQKATSGLGKLHSIQCNYLTERVNYINLGSISQKSWELTINRSTYYNHSLMELAMDFVSYEGLSIMSQDAIYRNNL